MTRGFQQAEDTRTNFNAHLRAPNLSFADSLKDFDTDIDKGPACDCPSSDPVRLVRRHQGGKRPSVE